MDAKQLAAVDLLARMLTGIQHPTFVSGDEPTFSMDGMNAEGTGVEAKLVLPSGDAFRVTVEWLGEVSP